MANDNFIPRSGIDYTSKAISSSVIDPDTAIYREIAQREKMNAQIDDAIQSKKVRVKDNIFTGIAKFFAKGVVDMVGQGVDVGTAIVDPTRSAGVPDEFDWLTIAALADEFNVIPSLLGIDYSHVERINRKRIKEIQESNMTDEQKRVQIEAITMHEPMSIIETEAKILGKAIQSWFSKDVTKEDWRNYRDDLTNQKAESWNQMYEKGAMHDTKFSLPGQKQVAAYLRSNQGTEANWAARQMMGVGDKLQEWSEDIGDVKTGNESVDYVLNGTRSLVASISSSVFTGRTMAVPFKMLGKARMVQARPFIANSVEKIGQFSIASAQTGGETVGVAQDAYKQVLLSSMNDASNGLYEQELTGLIMQSISDDGKQKMANGDHYNLSRDDEQIILNVEREFRDVFIAKHPRVYEAAKIKAEQAFQVTAAVNTANLAFNWFSAGFYLKGDMPTRSIIKDPRSRMRDVFSRDTFKGGVNEYWEETVNEFASQSGISGDIININQMADIAISKEGFETGAWGFVGGAGELAISKSFTFNARMKQHQKQLQYMLKQDKIGSTMTEEDLNGVVNLDQSIKNLSISMEKIKILNAQGKTEEANAEKERMLANQAHQAFSTGTVENLIKNYEAVANNENFSQETRDRARAAVTKVKSLEKTYNNSLKYKNSEDVYFNRVNKSLLEQQKLELEAELSQLKLEAIKELNENKNYGIKTSNELTDPAQLMEYLTDPELDTETEKEAIGIAKEKNALVRVRNIRGKLKNLSKSIAENNDEHNNLTSTKKQLSLLAQNAFYEEYAETAYKMEREFYANEDNKGKTFDPYLDPKMQEAYKELLAKYNNKMTAQEVDAIKELNEKQRKDSRLNNAITAVRKREEEKKKAEAEAKAQQENPVATPTNTESVQQQEQNDETQTQEKTKKKRWWQKKNDANEVKEQVKQEPVTEQPPSTESTNTEPAVEKTEGEKEEEFKENLGKAFEDDAEIIREAKRQNGQTQDPQKDKPDMSAYNDDGTDLWDDGESGDPAFTTDMFPDEYRRKLAVQSQAAFEYLATKKGVNNFESFIKAMIDTYGRERVEKMYPALVMGYKEAKLPGYNDVDYNDIFRELVINPVDKLVDLIEGFNDHVSSEEIEKIEKKVEDGEQTRNDIKENATEVIDNTVIPVEHDGFVLDTENSTIAHQSMQTTEMVEGNETLEVTHVPEQQWADGKRAKDQLHLLHPETAAQGTELTVTIADDVMNQEVDIYDERGRKIGVMTFGEWVNANNIDVNSVEYAMKVPMVYKDADGKVLGRVHDIERITPIHHTEKSVKKYRENTMAIRASVMNSTEPVIVVVTHKSGGNFSNFKLDSPVKLKDADPTSKLGIIVMGATGKTIYYGNANEQINAAQIRDYNGAMKRIPEGSPVELRQIGMVSLTDPDTGETKILPQYEMWSTRRSQGLQENLANTVYWLVNAYLNKGRLNHADTQVIKRLMEDLNTKSNGQMKVDTMDDLMKAIGMYVYTHDNLNNTKGGTDEQIMNTIIGAMAERTPAGGSSPFFFSQGGKLHIGNVSGYNREDMSPEALEEKINTDSHADIHKSVKILLSFTGMELDSNTKALLKNISDSYKLGIKIDQAQLSDVKQVIRQHVKSIASVYSSFSKREAVEAARQTMVSSQYQNEGDSQEFLFVLKNMLPTYMSNVSKKGLDMNGRIPLIDGAGQVQDGYENYHEQIRDNITTMHGAKKLTLERNGKEETIYVSFAQPRVEVALKSNMEITDSEASNALAKNELSDSLKLKLKVKIASGAPLTTQEEMLAKMLPARALSKTKNEPVEESNANEGLIKWSDGSLISIEEANRRTKELLEKRFNRASKVVKRDKKLGEDPEEESADPMMITEETKVGLSRATERIKKLSSTDSEQIINYLFYKISEQIKSLDGKNINLAELRKNAIDQLKEHIAKQKEAILEELPYFESKINELTEAALLVEAQKKELEKMEIVLSKEGLASFEEDVTNMVNKYMNLKKVKGVPSNEDIDPEDDMEYELEEIAEKEKGYSKNSYEVNNKDSVTAEMKRFCQGIENRDSDGKVIEGLFGIPTYVGFDTVFNTVSSMLADTYPDYDLMLLTLNDYKNSHPWMETFIERLNASPQNLKNQFVTAMYKHGLDMEFIMYSKNKNGRYSLKVFSTNAGAIKQNLVERWKSNILTTGLVIPSGDGNYAFSYEGITKALEDYKVLKSGGFAPPLHTSITRSILELLNKEAEKSNNQSADPAKKTVTVASLLKTVTYQRGRYKLNLPLDASKRLGDALKGNEMVQFTHDGTAYAVIEDKGSFYVTEYKAQVSNAQNVINFLANFGIEISEKTAKDIINNGFRYSKNSPPIPFTNQWDGEKTGKGTTLFGTLAGTLATIKKNMEDSMLELQMYDETGENGTNIISQSIIMDALAKMEAKNTPHRVVSSFYDGHKSIYGYTASKFITDRIRDLKYSEADGSMPYVDELQEISFNQNSFWLTLLKESPKFAEQFKISHLGITGLKELGKKLYRDNDLQSLSEIDQELVKIGFFQADQGEIQSPSLSKKYPALNFRMASMFSPTMSNKSTMTVIKTIVMNITKSTMRNFDTVVEFVYTQTMEPEVKRMIDHINNDRKTNIAAYDNGARLFHFFPKFNDLLLEHDGQQKTLRDLMVGRTKEQFEQLMVTVNGQKISIKNLMNGEIKNFLQDQQQKKIQDWKKAKYIVEKDGVITEAHFIDSRYLDKRGGSDIDEKVKIAAMDFVANSVIANANFFMVIAGDPAMYYKNDGKRKDSVDLVDHIFKNVGKRLAAMIAPGNKMADAHTNKYVQVMISDNMMISQNIKYITKALDGKEVTDEQIAFYKTLDKEDKRIWRKDNFPKSQDYFNIESTNGQEYTTWQEHLYILEKMGKLSQEAMTITPEEIEKAREIFLSTKTLEQLTPEQSEIIRKVMQPMKPVYTGQVQDKVNNVMRTYYIKTSAFPLIPQLTAGMEIDKLRKGMEDLQKTTGMTVRVSHDSGNKVGAVANSLSVMNPDGTFKPLSASALQASSVVLPRSNFRIQQNVPIKSLGKTADEISKVTQAAKLLFGNGVIDMTGFSHNGKPMTGKELHELYTQLHIKMVDDTKMSLYRELGINYYTKKPYNREQTMQKISEILKKEAVLRGYSSQDIEALGIDPKTGDFILPLWMSPSSARYEALLSAIANRIVKTKMPGYSYVSGSENGFKMKQDLDGIDQSSIVFTSNYDFDKGYLTKNQVFIPSKIRLAGELIDLYAKDSNGQYIWIKEEMVNGKKVMKLNEDKIDKDLLSIPSFRIPNSKHSSMEEIVIAGILPAESADLIIVSKDGTVAMGEDYDIDKRYTYHFWTTFENGKIIPLHKSSKYSAEGKSPLEVLEEQEKEYVEKVKDLNAKTRYEERFRRNLDSMVSDIVNNEEISADQKKEELKSLQATLKEFSPDDAKNLVEARAELAQLRIDKKKLIQNEIISIYQDVFAHEDVQKMMYEKLSVDDARSDAEFLEELTKEKDEYFTPLSDMYQRRKVINGATGKDGTAAYSLDVVGHSLFQQSRSMGEPIYLQERVLDEELGVEVFSPLTIRFGNQVSDGVLGKNETIDGARKITDVLSERQNLMVDDENEQIASRVHLNEYTMKVDKILNLLGFDKGSDGRSISFMFISQPIIKRYVELMEQNNSNTAEYNPRKKEAILDQLRKEFGYVDGQEIVNRDGDMTNGKFIEEIQNNGEDLGFQLAVLEKFLKIEEYSAMVTNIQTMMNVDSRGIGKNLLETYQKTETIFNLRFSTDGFEMKDPHATYVANADKLIGDFMVAEGNVEMRERLEQGYVLIDTLVKENIPYYYMVKPTTFAGAYVVHGLSASRELWGNFFPYKDRAIRDVFNEILSIIGNSDMRDAKLVQLKTDIFKDIKRYLVTDPSLEMTDLNVQEERERLFLDIGEKGRQANTAKKVIKQSLAGFMQELSTNGSKEVKELFRTNRLLNRLTYDVNINSTTDGSRKPSLIKFNASAVENFDETYMYNALIELLETDVDLGTFNGKPYTSFDLAQDLALYAYMEGGIQEAVQFVKYIPVKYLTEVLHLQRIGNDGTKRSFTHVHRNLLGLKYGKTGLSTFSLQYIQHHPAQVPTKLTQEMIDNPELVTVKGQTDLNDLSTLNSFVFATSQPPPFISFYNENVPSGYNRHQLYQYNPDTKMYERIPVLGTTGINEYMVHQNLYPSIVNNPGMYYDRHKGDPQLNPEPNPEPGPSGRFEIASNDIYETVRQISELEGPIGKLAQMLLPLIDKNIMVQIKPLEGKNGSYRNGIISINSNFYNDKGVDAVKFATTVMREVVHSITDKVIMQYVDRYGNEYKDVNGDVVLSLSDPNMPKHIRDLVILFRETQKHLKTELDEMMASGVTKTLRQYNVIYGGTNLFEFVERMLTSADFQKEMNKVTFKNTNLTLAEKFWGWIKDAIYAFAESFGVQLERDSITAHSLKNIFAVLQEREREIADESSKALKTHDKANKTLGKDFGAIDDESLFDDDPDILIMESFLKTVPVEILGLLNNYKFKTVMGQKFSGSMFTAYNWLNRFINTVPMKTNDKAAIIKYMESLGSADIEFVNFTNSLVASGKLTIKC